jgi:hypothetical protein
MISIHLPPARGPDATAATSKQPRSTRVTDIVMAMLYSEIATACARRRSSIRHRRASRAGGVARRPSRGRHRVAQRHDVGIHLQHGSRRRDRRNAARQAPATNGDIRRQRQHRHRRHCSGQTAPARHPARPVRRRLQRHSHRGTDARPAHDHPSPHRRSRHHRGHPATRSPQP